MKWNYIKRLEDYALLNHLHENNFITWLQQDKAQPSHTYTVFITGKTFPLLQIDPSPVPFK